MPSGTCPQRPREGWRSHERANLEATPRPTKCTEEPPNARLVDGSRSSPGLTGSGARPVRSGEHGHVAGSNGSVPDDDGPALVLGGAAIRTTAVSPKRSPILVELALVVFLVWIYNWVQDVAPLRLPRALDNARGLLSFETAIGLDPERALDHWLAHQQVLAYVTSNFYAIAIFAVTFGFAAWTWWRRPDIYVPLRNEIVLANLIAFAVFWAFPVAPPRMLPGFIDVVATSGGLGWHNTLVHHADQLAAMPSMHVGYAVWSSLVAWRLARSRGAKLMAILFGMGYSLLTAVSVLATGNHYLLDLLGGVATVVLSVAAVEAVPDLAHRVVGATAPARARRPSILGPNPPALKANPLAEGDLGPAPFSTLTCSYESSHPNLPRPSGPAPTSPNG